METTIAPSDGDGLPHNDLDPEYGERLGDYYEGFLREEMHDSALSRDALANCSPAARPRRHR